MPNGDCPIGAKLSARVDNLVISDHEQWEAIKAIQTRLPLWATFILSGLGAAIGISITIIISLIK